MSLVEMWSLLADAARVAAAVPRVERDRLRLGTAEAVARARARGTGRPARPAASRLRLRRAVLAVDTRLPGGANCYRRALLEMSLDRAAAAETLHLDLSLRGPSPVGHTRLESWPENGRLHDATFSL
jgi:hypothetical protein